MHFLSHHNIRLPTQKVAEFGNYNLDDGLFAIQAELFLRGPVKASVNAGPLLDYNGGILVDSAVNRNATHNHGVSIVGWGYDDFADIQYWIVRNSVRDNQSGWARNLCFCSISFFLSFFLPRFLCFSHFFSEIDMYFRSLCISRFLLDFV